MIPFWFWFLTATVALGAIAVSSYVVIFMKLAELDKHERAKGNNCTKTCPDQDRTTTKAISGRRARPICK